VNYFKPIPLNYYFLMLTLSPGYRIIIYIFKKNPMEESGMKPIKSLFGDRASGIYLLAAATALWLAMLACNVSSDATPLPSGGPPDETATTETGLLPTQTAAETATEEPTAAPGSEQDDPAARTETVVTSNWEFSIVEVLRGDEALSKLEEASSSNGPPDDAGMEYVLVQVHARYIGSGDEKHRIDPTFFKSIDSANVIYDKPSILDVRNPSPILQAELSPDEEYEGWITVLATAGGTDLVLIVQPRDNGMLSGEEEWRYISLEP
jgi:hypothetical protein